MRQLDERIAQADCLLVLAAMYVSHRGWIQSEIEAAIEFKRPIIAIKPRGQERVPEALPQVATIEPVGWNKDSIISAIRGHTAPGCTTLQRLAGLDELGRPLGSASSSGADPLGNPAGAKHASAMRPLAAPAPQVPGLPPSSSATNYGGPTIQPLAAPQSKHVRPLPPAIWRSFGLGALPTPPPAVSPRNGPVADLLRALGGPKV